MSNAPCLRRFNSCKYKQRRGFSDLLTVRVGGTSNRQVREHFPAAIRIQSQRKS